MQRCLFWLLNHQHRPQKRSLQNGKKSREPVQTVVGFDSQAPAGLNRSSPAATTAIHRTAARHFRLRAQSWRNPPYSRRRGPRRSRRWPATGARGGEVSADRVGRRRRLVANRMGALTLTASTNIFPPATEGVSTPPMKGSLNYACCVQSAGWRHGVSGRVDHRGKAYCWRQQDKGVLLFALGRQEHGHFDGKPGGLVVSISSRYLRLRWGKYHSRGDGVVPK